MLTGEVANLECTKLISVTGKITYRHGVANNSGHTSTLTFLNFATVAKFRQIWPHWHSNF